MHITVSIRFLYTFNFNLTFFSENLYWLKSVFLKKSKEFLI